MQYYYQSIYAFFDCYGLSAARSLLGRMIKTADADKIWKGRSPADLLFFTEKMEELMEAVFSLVSRYDHKPGVVLDKESADKLWSLTDYENYCGWHINSTPWDFFPRHLSKKEFLDPYKALEKFTRYHSLDKWKDIFKELLFHALSPASIGEFDNGGGILRIYIHLHKLIEAAHLVEVRSNTQKNQRPHDKLKDKEGSGNQPGE